MPDMDTVAGPSWADEIDESDVNTLPAPTEKIIGDTKILTEYTFNDDGKKTKIVRTFKIEKKMVLQSIAQRKKWKKFGMSSKDRPGPDPSTTVVTDEILMQFISGKDEAEKDEEKSALDELKNSNKGVVKCRICKEDHWTTMCPYRETLGPLQESLAKGTTGEINEEDKTKLHATPGAARLGAATGSAYTVPQKRDGARVGEVMADRKRDESIAIRVSNLSENVLESDLQELFKPFGPIQRVFLAKDKQTGICKGYGFVNYQRKEDALRAINTLHGYGYDHLILNVEWAKPSGS